MIQQTVVTVSRELDGAALGSVLRAALGAPWSVVKKLCARGKVRVDGRREADPGCRLRAGQVVEVQPDAPRADVVLARERLVFHDAQVVVFDKPAGLDSVPFEPGARGSLADLLGTALHRWGLAPVNAPLFVVHRLDRESSGLLVFGRTWLAKRHLAGLFRQHDVERAYLAIAHGTLSSERTVESWILEDRGDGRRGSARTPGQGQRAVTHLRPVARLPGEGGATLVECRLETGRQHQIRIHLSEAGHPLVGERVYVRGYRGRWIEAPRVMLHARVLGFTHPATGAALRFESPLPEDFVAVARRLGWTG